MKAHVTLLAILSVSSAAFAAAPPVQWAPVTGQIDIYGLPVVYPDKKLDCTPTRFQTTLQQVADMYYRASFGQLQLQPIVVGDPDRADGLIGVDYTCEEFLATQNDTADMPYVLDEFERLTGKDAYTLPVQSNRFVKAQRCYGHGSAGLGSAYAPTGVARIARCKDAALIAHELGHTMGMAHASRYRPEAPQIGQGGVPGEYSDLSDFMGNGKITRGINAPHRMQMGWIPDENVTLVTSNTEVRLRDMETVEPGGLSTAGTLVIKIPLPGASATSPYMRDFYYISLRNGRLFVHGVELNPYNSSGDEFVWGNTLLYGKTSGSNYKNRDGVFSLVKAPLSETESAVSIIFLK